MQFLPSPAVSGLAQLLPPGPSGSNSPALTVVSGTLPGNRVSATLAGTPLATNGCTVAGFALPVRHAVILRRSKGGQRPPLKSNLQS